MVQIFGAIGEWILGNTFSCALFFTYVMSSLSWTLNVSIHLLIGIHRFIGTFWLVQGTSLMPFFAVGTMYSPEGNTLKGMETAAYSATVG